MTHVVKGFKALTQVEVQRRLLAYPQLQQVGAFDKWLTALPTIEATRRTAEKKECGQLRDDGLTPALLFSRRLPAGRAHQALLSVRTNRLHDLIRREGFTGRHYWLHVAADDPAAAPHKVLVRPHQVQIHATSGRPTNVTFCLVEPHEHDQAVAAAQALLTPALGSFNSGSGPKAKRG